MTQTPREAAEAVRNEAVSLCGVFGLGLDRMKVRSLIVALRAIPLPAPSEPTGEGQVVLDDVEIKKITAVAVEIVEKIRDDNLKYAEMVYLVSEPLFTVVLSEKAARADLARMKAAMEELRAQIEPCGCELGRCEQFPDKELLYYGRLCRDRAALDALKVTPP